MAFRDNLYRPDEQKERDRMRAKEDAKIRAKVARRRAKASRVSDKDVKSRKDALKKAQPLTPYKRVIRSKKTQEGAVARLEAKKEGQAAAVRIAKARAAKKKKAPFTLEAKEKNRRVAVERKIVASNIKGGYTTDVLAAAKKQARLMIETGEVKRSSRNMRSEALKLLESGKMPHLSGFKISDARRDLAERQERTFRKESKAAARVSGGYATAMKRNAEAGIAHIVRGQAAKRAARASGVLGIASLFAQHIAGSKKEKKNG